MKFTDLTKGRSQTDSLRLAQLLTDFVDIEEQLDIGDVVHRSWEQEDFLTRARDIAMQLRTAPWEIDVDLLDVISNNTDTWRTEIAQWLASNQGEVA